MWKYVYRQRACSYYWSWHHQHALGPSFALVFFLSFLSFPSVSFSPVFLSSFRHSFVCVCFFLLFPHTHFPLGFLIAYCCVEHVVAATRRRWRGRDASDRKNRIQQGKAYTHWIAAELVYICREEKKIADDFDFVYQHSTYIELLIVFINLHSGTLFACFFFSLSLFRFSLSHFTHLRTTIFFPLSFRHIRDAYPFFYYYILYI